MKVLDADELQSGINNTQNGLKHLSNQLETLEMSILSISSLESELRGEGGNSIRAFYKDVHLPFLHSMKQMVEQYEATLKELTQSLRSLDSSSRAMIRQSFIQQDLTQGIRRTKNITSDLTDEGNRTIQSVDDIVSLPRLDDHRVHQHAQSATSQMTQTIERLHHFDQQQTNKLEATAQDLSRLKSTISEIQTLFQNGTLSLSSYQPNQLAHLLNNPVIGGMSLSQTYGPMALGMMPTYAPFSSMNFAFGGQPIKDIEKNQSTLGWISTGLDFVPVLSNLKAGIEAATGTDFITGREIGNLERAALVAAIFGGPLVKGGIKVVKWGSKLFSKVKNVLNPQKVKTVVDGIFSKVTQGFHALRNTAAELMRKFGDVRIPLQPQFALAGSSGGVIRTSGGMTSNVNDTLVRASSSVRDAGGKGTGKLTSTKDIYKVSPKDISQALEGYEQTHKFKAHFRGFEVKAQRSLSHMSDKQLVYSFKKGYSPKDGANDTIVLHHHEQKVEGPIIEMPSRYHDLGNKRQHPFGNSGGVGSGEARIEFNKWRKEYWKARYANEMIKRGIIE
ncbi:MULTISPECIES: T7SS effector LXG polymorphic toxin [Cytobacillus]|uniref:LXG domain-containing protein n=1 Tax=Cytobacillus stercorigallinarum TaxID=2762240 RepID=A0ABR8QW44_9BACI|nr:T7SS effector LXG polymorphic toxin [Cytobacillus stercorigallinarum]MBD7939674.1 hypothetical protein [Cytobacillus stercorigallinarum]